MSSHPTDKTVPEFKAWLAPKPTEALQFNEGLNAKHAEKFTVDPSAGLVTDAGESHSSEFTLWQPRRVAAKLETSSQEQFGEPIAVEEEEQVAAEPLVYTQSQLQEYGENQYAQGLAQAREEEMAKTGETRERLESLIETLGEQRVDTSAFYEPLKQLLVKSVETVLKAPLIESRAAVEELLSHLLREVDQDSEGEAASVKLFLSPEDLRLVDGLEILISDKVKLLPDASLSRGSLRATMQESIVENLVESRLTQLSEQLLSHVEPAAEQGEETANIELET